MTEGGLFITLYDKDTLKLYLENGIYGQLMSVEEGKPSPYSVYYKTLADYGCCREDNHVFFFLKREIYYGGQIKGSKDHGSFYLNGKNGPMGRDANAPLVWDESKREDYEATDTDGVFVVGDNERCQHFLIRFEDKKGLLGKCIASDQLYFRLGEYPYPLPSNSISGMGFCTLTPGETNILLELMENEPKKTIEPVSDDDVDLEEEPMLFETKYGIDSLSEVSTESHLEASVAADPSLLPEELKPRDRAICRQVAISPFKPAQMDMADLCYYSEDSKGDGTIPDVVIELKHKKAGKGEIVQIIRYLEWLEKLNQVYDVETEHIQMYMYAPDYTRTVNKYIPENLKERVNLLKFDQVESSSVQTSL